MKKMIHVVLAVLCISCVAMAKPGPAVLTFAMRFLAEEKVLGASTQYYKRDDPAIAEERVYWPKNLARGNVVVFRDRDLDIVKFEFRYINHDNNGSDPSTGRAWAMPREFVTAALKFFEGPWTAKGRGYVSADGTMSAVVGTDKVTVTQL